jgi:hypothetical protein
MLRRTVKYILAGVSALVLLLALALGLAWWWLAHGGGGPWLLDFAKNSLKEDAGVDLQYSKVEGNILESLSFKDVSLTRNGHVWLKADRLELDYSPLALLSGHIYVKRLELDKPVISLTDQPGEEEDPGDGPMLALRIVKLRIKDGVFNAGADPDPLKKADQINLELSLRSDLRGLRIKVASFSGRTWWSGWDESISFSGSGEIDDSGFEQWLVDIAMGPDRGKGSLTITWGDGVYIGATLKGELSAYHRVPLDWPGRQFPQGPLKIDGAMSGTWPRLDFKAKFSMLEQNIQGKATLDWRSKSFNASVDIPYLIPKTWGLIEPELVMGGHYDLNITGLSSREPLAFVAKADLPRLELPGWGRAGTKLRFDWPRSCLSFESLSYNPTWGSVNGSGEVWLDSKHNPERFQASLGFDSLTLPPPLKGRVPVWLHQAKLKGSARVSGVLDDLRLKLELERSRLRQGLEMSSAQADMRIRPNRVEVATVRAAGPWGSIQGGGGLDADTGDLNWTLESGDYPELRAALSAAGLTAPDMGIKGLSLKGGLSGDWADFKLNLKAEAEELSGWDLKVASLKAEGGFDIAGERVDGSVGFQTSGLEYLGATARSAQGELLIKPGGKLELEAQINRAAYADDSVQLVDITAEYDYKTASPQGKAWLRAGNMALSGRIWPSATVQAGLAKDGLKLKVAANSPGLGIAWSARSRDAWGKWRRFVIRDFRLDQEKLKTWKQNGLALVLQDNKGWNLSGFSLHRGGARAGVAGYLSPDGAIDAELNLKGVRLAGLIPQAASLGAKATMAADLRIWGSRASPLMRLEGRVDRLDLPDKADGSLTMRIDYNGLFFKGDGQISKAGKPLVKINASLEGMLSLEPFSWRPGGQGLDAHLRADKVPLKLLEPLVKGIEIQKGQISLDLRASGDLTQPETKGEISLAGGEMLIPANQQRLQNISGKATFDGENLVIERLEVLNGGRVLVNGRIERPWSRNGVLEVDLSMERFRVEVPGLGRLQLSSYLTCRGDMRAPLINGWLRPQRIDVLSGLAPPSDFDEVVVLKKGEAPPPMEKKKRSLVWNPEGLLGRAEIYVNVELPEDKRVTIGPGWLRPSGELILKKQPRESLTYHERVQIKQGVFVFSGKRFENIHGAISFEGRPEPVPDLDIQAVHTVGRSLIFVTVTGKADDPTLQLSSQPPMSRADIISTLIYGRPTADLTSKENSELTAQALALVGQGGAQVIQGVLGPVLSPDVVTFHEEQGSRKSSLEAGKYVADDLYLRYRENVGSQGGRNIGLELKLRRWLLLESQLGEQRTSGVDLTINFDF